MKRIYADNKSKKITQPENINFDVKTKSLHLIQIAAKTQSERQLSGTDDEDLRIELNHQKFPQLTNENRYFDSPAAFSGGTSKGLTKTIYFLVWLDTGPHTLRFIPDIGATLNELNIRQISNSAQLDELTLQVDNQAENGDRRDWITFVLVNTALTSFTPELTLQRRFLDNDDVRVIIDGDTKKKHHNLRQKLWYFVASLIKGESQKKKFTINFSSGLHYLEFWADRTPTLKQITFSGLIAKIPKTIQEKIIYRANQYDFDPRIMLRLVKRESQFDLQATSHAGAKGLFQLTSITIKEIAKHGLKITDPYDVDQNIEGGFIYFNWLYQRYAGHIKKTLAAWNWGLGHVPVNKPLDWDNLPTETQNLINDVLGDHDF